VRGASFSIAALLLLVASGLTGCGARGTPETKLFGLVKFPEPTSLPAGARVEVHLDDAGQVSGSGALKSPGPTTTSIATQTVDAGGQRSPISFTLAVPRTALLPRHRYVLRAEVRSPAGDLLFSTPPNQPPISNPNTTGRIELAVIPASH
jgi:putative lipoprotein